MKLYLCSKTVLRFYPAAGKFINDYSTNVAEAPRNAFVDLHGRIVAVVDQQKINVDEVWIILETRCVERLLSHLKKYLSLSETTLEKLDAKKVYWDLEAHKPIVTDQSMPEVVSEEEFTRYRVQNNLRLQGVDYDDEMILNLADDTLVSYTKGCYLGQEIVARVHYRGRAPKKIVVRSENECTPEESARMTSKVWDPVRSQTVGFVLVSHVSLRGAEGDEAI